VGRLGKKAGRKGTTWKVSPRVEDNIKMNLKYIEWEGVDWIHLVKDRDQWWTLVNTVMNLRV
jgi:hypothetical protein